MKDLKNKLAIVSIITLVFFICLLLANGDNKHLENKVIVKEATVKTLMEGNQVSGNSTLKYKLKYKLESDTGETINNRIAIVDVILNEEAKKYITFTKIEKENITSEIIEDGKILRIRHQNVTTNKDYELELTIKMNNAPDGYTFSPRIEVKDAYGQNKNIQVEKTTVETTSIEGKVLKNNKPQSGIRITLCKMVNNLCVNKRETYSREDGTYTFSDIEEGNYKLETEEGYEIENNEIDVIEGNNVVNVDINTKQNFKAKIRKYIKEVEVNENGTINKYNFDKKQKVNIPIKGKGNIKLSILYEFEITNTNNEAGFVKVIKENIPEGMKLDKEYSKNKDWKENNGVLYNKTLSKHEIKPNETKKVTIKLNTTNTSSAKKYLNKVSITGEIYHSVKYIVEDEEVKNLVIVDSDKVNDYNYTKDGYVFEGWYKDKEYKEKFNFNTPIEKDTIIYGKIKNVQKKEYKIIYKLDNDNVYSEETIDEGNKATKPKDDPIKVGYKFIGWKQGGSETLFDFDEVITENKILYAVFEKNKYTVRFINEGEEYNKQEIEYKGTITKPIDPENKYYRFVGWYEKNSEERFKVEDEIVTRNITLYAKYEVIKYTVRFYDNDKVINEKTEYEAGSMIDIPSDPEKEGYTFIGWYKDGEDNAYNFVDGLVTEDVDLYSKYEKNKYVVTFYNENEEEITKEEVEHGERIKNVPDTNKKYYRFVGWYEKGETEKFDLTKEIKKNINLYAKYEVIKYTVRFYDNDKVINEKTEYEAGSMIDIPSDPEKEGYTFTGWYKEGEDEEYNFVDNLVTEDVDLYSKYEINKYKVEYYDVNPETKKEEKVGSEEVEYNKEVGKIEEIEGQIGKKTGYTLVGWIKENKEEFVRREKIKENIKLYTKYVEVKNGVIFDDEGRIETKEVQEGKTVEKIESKGKEGYTFKYWSKDKINEFDFNTPIVETITLYAVYEINSYILTVKPNGGMYNGSVETKTYTLNYGEEKIVETPTKEGYTFTGWTSTVPEALNEGILTMPSSDVTLEANYEINSYTLTVNPNGGMYNGSVETKTYTLNYGEEKIVETPTKEGYTFTGWTSTVPEALNEGILTMPSSDVTLEANYEINSYTLIVNPNGGMYNGSVETKTYTLNYGEEKIVETPTKEGYTFTGWTSTVPEALNEGILTMPSSDVTLEANYEINSYTLTVNPNGGVYNGTKEETVYNLNYGEEKEIENPTKEGYTFTGWTVSIPEALNEGIVTMPSSNVTLEANYEINKYTVRFINEGEEYNKQEVEYKGKVTKPEEPEKEGYTFKYWSKDKALEYNLEEEVTEDVTLYSVYEINKYTVTFENEGQVYETRKVNYKEKVSAPEENPRKENNIFRGWNKENTLYDFESEVISDITLNAVYEEVEKPVISHEPISWTNDKVMVTVTNDNHPEYSFKYKIDNGEYKDYTGPFEVLENSVVTGISIKENVESKEEIHEIKNIDKISPTIISLEENSEIKSAVSAKIKIKAKDEESGIKEIKIYVDGEEKGSIEKEEGTVSEQTEEYEITGLEELTSYRVKIKVIDYAGNEKESDEIEVTTIEKDYVAQIIKLGEEDKSESPIRKETLEEAIEYCNITECTIQMIKGTTENVEVLEGQKIKLDLNGQIVRSESGNTIINTGDLTIIDNGEAVGQIISEQGIGVQNRKILTVGENEEELEVSTSKPNIIGNITGIESPTVDLNGSHAGVEFKFLDGRIEGNVAITGTVTETPYLYNTKVESGAKQVATLTILAEAEARINTTYYTKVSNAMNESKKGHYEESSETVQNLTKLSKTDKDTEYGFKYDEETGKLISTNQGIQNSVSNSYIKIDLTNETEDKILTVNAEVSSLQNYDIGYATVTESTSIPAYSNGTGRFIYVSGEVEAKDYKTTLTAGKIYYLHLGFRKYSIQGDFKNDTFTINSITLSNENNETTDYTYVAKVPVLNEEPDTIELLKNITLSSPMEIEDTRDVVLDLRGQTLTTQTTDYVVKNHGSLRVIDSKYTNDIESAQKKYEEEEAENQIKYDNALSEYNKNKNKIQNSYDEKYKSNLNELLKTQTTNDYVQDELLMHVDALSNEGTSEMQDISGNGNNGTMNRIQIQNNAFNFSGSTSYANFGKATDIGLTDNHSITLDMLISFSNGQGGRGLLSTFTDNTNGFMLGIDNNNYSKIRMFSNSDTSSQTARIISKNTLNDGNVHHLVGVYDCENKIMTLYIDGKLDSSKTFNSLTYGNNNLVLGATSISSQYFIGNIYNAKIYNKVLTEDEINQNYIVDKVRYEDASKKLTSNTSYGTVTSSNEDGAYKVFDGNNKTSWTSNLEENYILWQMPEEKTVTGYKIYGSSESSKYPKEVELLGSKDGENYDSLVTSELEQKGLNEYNTVQIETNKYDSYKYFKWKFKNDGNEISINEIDLDIYNISRQIYNDITNVSINNSDFMYNAKNTSNSSKSFNGNTNVLSTTTSNAENMSVLYYNKKITVKENSQYTANLKLGYYNNWSNSSLGTVYIGFSKTNERNKDDFDSYVIKDIDCLTEKIQNINVGIYEPGEYYFKIIVYHNSNTSGSTIYNNIYNLQFTSKPTKKETQLARSTHLGNITSTTGNVILNNENANLVLDSVEINLNKTGSSGSINNYSNAITNYGTLTALENSTINTNSRYSVLINNEPTGRLLKSLGKLNINSPSYSYGIYNDSRKDDFSIDGFKIFMKNYDQVYGICHVSNHDLTINNIEIAGSGSGIYKYNYNNKSNLSINDSVINVKIGVETGSNNTNINSSNVDIINTNINYNDTGIKNNSYSTINIKNSNINGIGNGITNYEKGIVNFYSGTIKSGSYPNVSSFGTEFNIYGGYFESTSYCLSNTRGTMNITGGEVLCNRGAINATYYKSPGGTVNIGGTFKINSQSKGAGITMDYSAVNIKDSVEIFSNTTSAIIVGNTSDNYINNPTTLNILGNNIIRSSAGNAINSKKSKSVINIGTKDGNVNKEYPKLISSKEYPSLYSSAGSTNYYDGIITGKKGSSIQANIEDSEDSYDLFINDNGNDLEDVVLEKPTLETFGNVAKIDTTYYPSIKSAVEALPDSEEKTIELLKDVRTIHQNIITDTKNGILDLNGKKITKYSLSPIFENNGIFKIKDSTTVVGENNVVIDGAGSLNNIFGKILENNGTLDFDSGTIITENQNNQAIINSGIMSINGGNISANSSQSCYRGGCTAFDTILNNENATLKVTGGTLYKKNKDSLINNSGILEITDGNFIGEVSDTTMYLVTNSSTGNVSITGGTYNVKASSYDVRLINNSGEANISNTTIDLFNILNNTGNITLTNVTAEKLDRKQCMENTGILNINGGKYILNGSDYYNCTIVVNLNTGQLNMENVDITADSIAIKNSSSSVNAVNIKSGKFNSVGKYSGNSNNKPTIYSSNGTVTIGDTNNVDSDGNKIVSKENPSFISNGTALEITGGKLNFYDGIVKGKTVAINGSVNEVEEGYELIKSSDDDYTEIIYLDKLPIVQVVGEDNPSYSIEEALETESCNGKECELDLLRKTSILSTSSSIRISEDKNVILDLNGYDISSSNELLFINNGTLKFKDSKRTLDNETISGTITSVSGKILENNGTFEYESGTISTENTNKDIIVNNSNMTISGGTISSTTNERNSKFNVIVNNENATLNITGGNLYKDELGSIVENSGILNITGGLLKGTISGYNKLYLVSTTSTGKTTITGGTYEGDGWNYGGVCVLLNQGVTNVTGINITSQMYGMKNEGEGILSLTDVSMDNIKFSAISNENGTVIINSGTYISQDYNGQRVGTIENSGGTVNVISGSFSGSYYGIYQSNNGTINIGNTNDLDSEGNKLVSKENPNIKGNTIGIYNNLGTLNFYDGIIKGSSSAISGNINDVEEGYTAVVGKETIDSTEFETKYLDKLPVAKIKSTDKEYYNLQEAIDESNDNDTIEILRNVTYSTSFNTIVIEENKNIKIDLNGYVITTPSELFENNGTLELIDSKNTLDENGYITSGTGYIVGSSNGIKLIDNKGTLKVSGAKIIGSELQNINVNPITNSGDLIINSGYVSTKKDGSYSGVITATVINNIENGNITMNGGMIESYGSSGGSTSLNGIIIKNTSTGLINLLGGKFYTNSNTNVTGIKNSANCNIIINGAELNKVDSINSTAGTIKIIEGVINGDIDNDESSNLTIDNGTINGNVLNRHVNSSITINGGIFNNMIGSNNGVLNITNGIFNDNVNHNNVNIWNGKVNITGGTYNATNRIISNDKGTINISNVTFENCSIGISQSGGTTNIKENTIINASDKGIDISGGTLNIGEKGNVSFDDPSITGTNYGVYNTNGKIYFYDGIIKGKQNQSIYGVVTEIEPGYKIRKTTENEVESSILEIIGTEERAIVVNGINFIDLQAAINAVPDNTETTMELYSNITLNSDIVIPEGKIINLYYRGYKITKGNYTITNNGTVNVKDEDTSGGILGTIKALLNIEDNNISKNIIVYQMDDGSILSSVEDYTLESLVNGKYEKIDVEEVSDEVGRYHISSNKTNTLMTTINGRIYLNNITSGSYKLVSSSGKEISFEISDEGTLSSNIKENFSLDTNKILSLSTAEIITSIRTGQTVIKFGILISLISVILSLLIIAKRQNEKYL